LVFQKQPKGSGERSRYADPAATAILDRFLAHATIVPVTGKSYRLRQRASTTDD
jgi:DNA replication protein DnaC